LSIEEFATTIHGTSKHDATVPAYPSWNIGGNLLAPLTPIFTNWTTTPTPIADIQKEKMGRGVSGVHGVTAANAVIHYDLGKLTRVFIQLDHQFADMILWVSDDNITYYQASLDNVGTACGVYRYLEIRCGAHADIEYIKTIVYEM
jgi:hypothetical protein